METFNSPHRIGIVVFPDCQIVDASGPAGVFGSANAHVEAHGQPAPYELVLIAPKKGAVRTSCGVSVFADVAGSDLPALELDTLICAGGKGSRGFSSTDRFIAEIAEAAHHCKRVVSVCTGAYLLAAAGLLDGRRVATHWGACADLQSRYPNLHVDEKPIFVRDGNVYTSAGVTAGLDLALALVQMDLGQETAAAVARDMVMFVRRPGNQAQFSRHLRMEDAGDERLRETLHWAAENLAAEINVETLADRTGMSLRSFHRHFSKHLGMPPARFLNELRLEAARRYLEQSALALSEIAMRSGFGGEDRMRRAFVAAYETSPSAYRQQFNDMDLGGQEA